MNLIDLELYKWKWFHDVHLQQESVKQRRTMASQQADYNFYWKETGAFIATLPRQSGKTSMLIRLSQMFDSCGSKEEYIVVASTCAMKKNLIARGIDVSKASVLYMVDNSINIRGIAHNDYNLMVEEYQSFGPALDGMLIYPWKTVTMVGTLG